MRGVFLSFALLLLVVRGTVSSNSYCTTAKLIDSDPKVPNLPSEGLFLTFHAKIFKPSGQVQLLSGHEAILVNQDTKKAMISYTTDDGHSYRMYVDMNSDVTSFYIKDGVCMGSPPFFPGDFSTPSVKAYMAMDGDMRYVGDNKTVRGIPVTQFQKCDQRPDNHVNFTMDYYFASSDWTSADGLKQMPVRLEMKGKAIHDNTPVSIHHIYDYINIRPFDKTRDANAFDIPVGVFCSNGQQTTLPTFPNDVFFIESTVQGHGKASVHEIFIDLDDEIARVTDKDSGDITIYDFLYRVEYDISDGNYQNCKTKPFNQLPGYLSSGPTTTQAITFKNFLYSNTNATYDGQRSIRGIACDMYTKPYFGGYVSLCFMKKKDGRQQLIYIKKNPSKTTAMTSQIYSFRPMPDPPLSPFDLSQCAKNSSTILVAFESKNGRSSKFEQIKREFARTASEKIASLIGLRRVRIMWKEITQGQMEIHLVITILEPIAVYYPYAKISQKIPWYNGIAQRQGLSVPECEKICTNSGDGTQYFTCSSFSYDHSKNLCTFYKYKYSYSLKTDSNVDYFYVDRYADGKAVTVKNAWDRLVEKVSKRLVQFQFKSMTYVAVRVESMDAVNLQNNSLQNYEEVETSYETRSFFQIITGVSLYDCAAACTGKKTHTCHSIKYSDAKVQCQLSEDRISKQYITTTNPAKTSKKVYRNFQRLYTTDFKKFPGLTVLSASDAIYINVEDVELCAHMCESHVDFTCLSFDYCSDSGGSCVLGKTHFMQAAQEDLKESPDCSHYTRHFIDDYKVTEKKVTKFKSSTEVRNVNLDRCATMCALDAKHGCSSFHYCPLTSSCAFLDKTHDPITNADFLAGESDCSTYSLKKGISEYQSLSHNKLTTGSTGALSGGSSSSSSNSYTSGQMAGLAFGALILGFLVVSVVLYTFFRLRRYRAGGGDSRSFNMSQLQESE